MKLISRPINWSPVLVVLLFPALALPGNAYSQQSDRVSKQQEHKRRATAEERSSKKNERTATRSATRSDHSRPQQRRPDTPRSNGNTARPPVAQGQRTGAPTRSVERNLNDGSSRQTPALRNGQSSQNQSKQNRGNRNPENRGPGNNSRGHAQQNNRPHQPNRDQDRRIRAEQQQANRYFAGRTQHRNAAAQRARILQQQRRNNQYRYQAQYQQRLRQQHAQWNSNRYNYYNDPFYYTPASYRYQFGGQWHTTNRYGADLMQQAVDYGYQEGLRAGRADREDGWRADYDNSYAYQDGSYGYNGRYISPSEYQYYFRQGFRRGYQDGYDNRYEYGYRRDDGSYAIVAAVLATIVGLHLLN